MRNPSPRAARTTSSSPSSVISTPRDGAHGFDRQIHDQVEQIGQRHVPGELAAHADQGAHLHSAFDFFFLAEQALKLATTVVEGEVVEAPSTKITVLVGGEAFSAN